MGPVEAQALKYQADILRGVEELTEEIERFKNEQISLYTSQESTTTVTDAQGLPVVVPTYYELQQLIASVVPGSITDLVAAKLATPRTIALSGAVQGSAEFDGSEDITIAAVIPPASVPTSAINGLDNTLASLTNSISAQAVAVTALQNQVSNGVYGRTYIQTEPATVWSVNHLLGKYPAVTVMDTAGTLIECGIEYVDLNNVVITSAYPISGTASFN